MSIIKYDFENLEVRTVVEGDEVWFVGRDVAKALGYDDEAQAVKAHCKRSKSLKDIASVKTPEGLPGNALLIQEPDLYRLIMRSRLPSAEKFEEWVVGEVLPSIRKTGKYSVPMTTAEFLLMQAQKMVEIERKQKEHDDRIHRIEAKQSAFEEGHSYFTVLGYCAYKGITVDLTAAKALGKSATAASKVKDTPIESSLIF